MPLDMQRAPKGRKFMYECPITGENFEVNDKKLIGMGNPPSSPNTPVGMGQMKMTLKLVTTSTTAKEK